ncbi:hypothetical protein ACQ4PT_034395 [Festuca glaucescens]
MGCTTSIEARRDMRWVEPAAVAGPRASRSFSLPSVDRQRLRSKAASVLGNLGLAQGRRSGATSCKYATLTVEEIMMKFESDCAAGAGEMVVLGPVKEMEAPMRQRVVRPKHAHADAAQRAGSDQRVGSSWPDSTTSRRRRRVQRIINCRLRRRRRRGCTPTRTCPWPSSLTQRYCPASGRALAEDTSRSQPVAPTDKNEPASRKDADDASACTPVRRPPGTCRSSRVSSARASTRFQEKIIERRASNGGRDGKVAAAALGPPGGKRRAVVYFTSLRGVRKTFVDCCSVRSILRSYGVAHRRARRVPSRRLQGRARAAPEADGQRAPRACSSTGGYLGGAEERAGACTRQASWRARWRDATPRRCASSGAWRRARPAATSGSSPCETCYGSCKIFVEDEDEDEGRRVPACPDCNENGLIGCPVCSC